VPALARSTTQADPQSQVSCQAHPGSCRDWRRQRVPSGESQWVIGRLVSRQC
jgi:hypothetical protein